VETTNRPDAVDRKSLPPVGNETPIHVRQVNITLLCSRYEKRETRHDSILLTKMSIPFIFAATELAGKQ
jgi:hypothetical protein